MADVGTGTTIAFGTSSFAAELMDLTGNDITREDVETTHMGTTVYRTYMPGDLLEGGTVEMNFAFDPDAQPPVAGAAETITVTFPLAAGQSVAAKVVFTGYVNSWSYSDPLEEKMTASATIKVDGLTDPVWTASS